MNEKGANGLAQRDGLTALVVRVTTTRSGSRVSMVTGLRL